MIFALIPLFILLKYMKLDVTSEARLIGLQASFLWRLRIFFLMASAIGWKITITNGKRSAAEQNRLHKLDARNPPAGNSSHEVGRAADLNATKAGVTLLKATPKPVWEATSLPFLMKLCGLRWGGNFATYFDPVHVDDL